MVDEEFSTTVQSVLDGLGDPKFTAARSALEDALGNLSPTRQSGKGLIRGVFEAVESAFLVVIEKKANRINGQSIEQHLKPLLNERYSGIPEAGDKIDRMLRTLKEWVNSAHPYRHGAPFEEVHEAPLDEAILSATIGMGFLRYFVGPVPSSDG